MSFDNNIDTMLSEIQWNFIVKIAFNFFTQCRIMDWIYFFPSLFGSNRIEIEKCDQFCKSVTMYSRIWWIYDFFKRRLKTSRFRKIKTEWARRNEMLLHWNLLQVHECNATKRNETRAPKVGCWIPFFRSIFRPLLGSTNICDVMRVCTHSVNAHCITTGTQVFVYNFVFHVFFLSHCSISLLRDMFVFAVLYVHTLWEEKNK